MARFRWAYCQLQQLKRSNSTQPKTIRAALSNLPVTLDQTYERILSSVPSEDVAVARTLLRLIAYADSPPSLIELAEASIIHIGNHPDADLVDVENRGSWTDTLAILAGLVIFVTDHTDPNSPSRTQAMSHLTDKAEDEAATKSMPSRMKHDRMQFAHFSVKEYLVSARIIHSSASEFHLIPGREHSIITQSCLAYLNYYSRSPNKRSTLADLAQFPFLQLARSWFLNARAADNESLPRIVDFLKSVDAKRDWLRICGSVPVCHNERNYVFGPDSASRSSPAKDDRLPSPLYLASLLGLLEAVKMLLTHSADINALSGHYGTALQAASNQGHLEVVKVLLQAGALTDIPRSGKRSALCNSSLHGHYQVSSLLIESGASLNEMNGSHNTYNPLGAACSANHLDLVRLLLDAGADANGGDTSVGCPLVIALASMQSTREAMVRLLLDAGADPDGHTNSRSSPLATAVTLDRRECVRLLLTAGADPNGKSGNESCPLTLAAYYNHPECIKFLLAAGASPCGREEQGDDPLVMAIKYGREECANLLLDADAGAYIMSQDASSSTSSTQQCDTVISSAQFL